MQSAVIPLIPSAVRAQSVIVEAHIHRLELFLYDQTKLALPEAYRPLHCGLLRIAGSGAFGWAEFEFSDGAAQLDLIKWGQVFRHLKRRQAAEAFAMIHQYEQQWGFTRTHLAAEALASWQKALSESSDTPSSESIRRHVHHMAGMTVPPTEREFLSYYCQSYYSF
ncbi:hypothetical protein [Paenibacillus campi]|uniref:hypothetical protein n=1 Tax=Paenibacillus campi TaxID=3106031 RepID=UPI002AFFA626|nr:hypothetical protein [Paenibacillus sp. SGZ-1014]